MRAVKGITLVYDDTCGLCGRLKEWIAQQDAFVPVDFVGAGSAEAQRRFGALPPGELAVVGDTGEVWLGDTAWIVCLWALCDYRDLAVRLTSPLLLTMAREAFSLVSRNRRKVSELLWRSEREIERELRRVDAATCQKHER